LSYGLNSQLAKVERKNRRAHVEARRHVTGPAIEKIVGWLEKAVTVTENDRQKQSLQGLIKYYRTGDIADFDQHCIAWVADTQSSIDVVNGFIEVYADAAQKRGSFESVVSMRDEEATKRIAAISARRNGSRTIRRSWERTKKRTSREFPRGHLRHQ